MSNSRCNEASLALSLTAQRPQGREGLGRGLFRRLAARPGAGFNTLFS